jgi:steroid delta-isomerase-like uncharacterized protein
VYGRPAERSCRRASEPNRDPGDNTYGKNSEERDLILGHLVEVEPLLRATCTHEVDATQPLRRGRSAARCHRTRGRRSMNSESGPFQANAALVLESFDAFNAGDTERLLAVVAPNLVMHLAELPEPLHGRETWRQGFELMKNAFPDLEAHVDDVVAADDIVAVRISFRGTHAGEFQGIPATGRTIHYVSHEFYRVAEGLIAEEWICSDMASLFRQLS